MLRLLQITEDLLDNKLEPATVSLIANACFAFVAAIGLPLIFLNPTLVNNESIFLNAVTRLIRDSHLDTGQLSFYSLKIYLYSVPHRLTAGMDPTAQIFLLRGLGLAFLLLGLWFVYQTARRVSIGNDFIPLAALSLLATNNRLFDSALTVGGDAFLFCFFAFFLYELVEITVNKSFVDVLICLALIFIISRVDVRTAQNTALPLLFFTIIIAMASVFKKDLLGLLPTSLQARAAVAAGLAAALVLTQKNFLSALIASTPTAALVAIYNITAWPQVIMILTQRYSSVPVLVEGFSWAQSGLSGTFYLGFLAGSGGIVYMLYTGILQHIEITNSALALPEGGSTESAYRIMWKQPDRSIFSELNMPAFSLLALMPAAVFATQNTYAAASIISEESLVFLYAPLALLLACGLRYVPRLGKSSYVGLGFLVAIVTFNISALLLTILW